MRTYFLSILLLFLTGCAEKQAKANEKPVKKSVTIAKADAFTNLVFDSTYIESFIQQQNLGNKEAETLRNFYHTRNYQYAWFTEEGLAEHAQLFWNLHNQFIQYSQDSSLVDKRLHQKINNLLDDEEVINTLSAETVQTELQLTQHFFEFTNRAYAGKLEPSDLQWHIPRKKLNAVALLDSLINNKGRNLEAILPINDQYKLIKNELLRYYDIEKSGGWNRIDLGNKKVHKKGDTANVIGEIKQRLYATGDLQTMNNSNAFDEQLEQAVLNAQKRFGLKADGVVGPATIAALNIPVEERIQQILINMERMRWMPQNPEGRHIVANIPEFILHVYEGNKAVMNMKIVVGKAANRSVIFNDELKYVVFSPYWNVPRSIVQNEILPALKSNPNYLQDNNMEQTGTSNGLPVIRQRPGPGNALGKVKFIFPNRYNIYFHDTPAKSLFENSRRAFSHGCIRVAQPARLAEYLLQDKTQWTDERMQQAMNAGKEKWVTLNEVVPVFISYFTAWVDQNGSLHFRDDIYGHDKRMKERLFE